MRSTLLLLGALALGCTATPDRSRSVAPRNEETHAKEAGETWHDKYKKDFREAQSLFRDSMAARSSDNPDEYISRWSKANNAANDCLATLDLNVEKYLDEDGVLLDEYSGYNEDYRTLTELRYDLLRTEPFSIGD